MKKYKPDIAELVIKMQQQLISLEKKIDTLVSRPSDRPFDRPQHPKPFQRFDRPRGHDERILHKAICADCNKECEVPFRPSQDRPVYCKECFAARKSGGPFKPGRDSQPRDMAPTRERPFDRYRKDEPRKPGGKKKTHIRRKNGRSRK